MIAGPLDPLVTVERGGGGVEYAFEAKFMGGILNKVLFN